MRKRSGIFFMAFTVLVLFSAGCAATERNAAPPPPPTPMMTTPKTHPSAPEWMADGATNRVADITDAPNAFIGKTVTVVAEVYDVYGPRAFTLDGEGPAPAKGAHNGLLTLIPKVGGFRDVDAQWKRDKARVTGVVQRMVVKDVEREIGWELPADLRSRFMSKPVLIARSFERLNR